MKETEEIRPLPDKPSELIRLALEDLRKVEQSEDYIVDMNEWHVPLKTPGRTRCYVCLAGAVMACSLKGEIKDLLEPENFFYTAGKHTDIKLHALENFRSGEIFSGLNNFYNTWDGEEDYPDFPTSITVVTYEDDPEGFHASMNGIAHMLEKGGH